MAAMDIVWFILGLILYYVISFVTGFATIYWSGSVFGFVIDFGLSIAIGLFIFFKNKPLGLGVMVHGGALVIYWLIKGIPI